MKYILFSFFSVLFLVISCDGISNKKNNKKAIHSKIFKNKKIKNESLNTEIINFIKENPKQQSNIETYYISFCINKKDTIITIQKGLYADFFAFIDKNIEYKGWLKYKDNFINFIDRKSEPIGQDMIDYTQLSKQKIKNKKVIEYHGQKGIYELFIDKQFVLKNGELKPIKGKKRICFFH